MDKQQSTTLLSILFVVLWSSGWVGAKYGLAYTGAFTLLTWRYLLVVMVLAALVSVYKAWQRIDQKEIFGHVSVGVLSHAAFLITGLYAIKLGVSSGLVAFVAALQPMVTALICSTITRESVDSKQWLGLTIGLAAVLLIIGDRIALGGSAIAYTLPIASVVAISLATLLDKRMALFNKRSKRHSTPILLVIFIHCVSALMIFAPLAAYLEGFEAQWGIELVFSIAWLALVVSLAAYGLLFVLLRRLETIKVSSLVYLSPPTTMLIAYLVLGESLRGIDLIGLVIAAFAVWIVSSNRFEIFFEKVKKDMAKPTAAQLRSTLG